MRKVNPKLINRPLKINYPIDLVGFALNCMQFATSALLLKIILPKLYAYAWVAQNSNNLENAYLRLRIADFITHAFFTIAFAYSWLLILNA